MSSFIFKAFLINFCTCRLSYCLGSSTSCTHREEEIIPNESKYNKCYRKSLRNRFYMRTIMTKFIKVNLRYDKKTEDENHKQSINSKAKSEHM
jgi:hypothetical protein